MVVALLKIIIVVRVQAVYMNRYRKKGSSNITTGPF